MSIDVRKLVLGGEDNKYDRHYPTLRQPFDQVMSNSIEENIRVLTEEYYLDMEHVFKKAMFLQRLKNTDVERAQAVVSYLALSIQGYMQSEIIDFFTHSTQAYTRSFSKEDISQWINSLKQRIAPYFFHIRKKVQGQQRRERFLYPSNVRAQKLLGEIERNASLPIHQIFTNRVRVVSGEEVHYLSILEYLSAILKINNYCVQQKINTPYGVAVKALKRAQITDTTGNRTMLRRWIRQCVTKEAQPLFFQREDARKNM